MLNLFFVYAFYSLMFFSQWWIKDYGNSGITDLKMSLLRPKFKKKNNKLKLPLTPYNNYRYNIFF